VAQPTPRTRCPRSCTVYFSFVILIASKDTTVHPTLHILHSSRIPTTTPHPVDCLYICIHVTPPTTSRFLDFISEIFHLFQNAAINRFTVFPLPLGEAVDGISRILEDPSIHTPDPRTCAPTLFTEQARSSARSTDLTLHLANRAPPSPCIHHRAGWPTWYLVRAGQSASSVCPTVSR
jgi:hypothetical protein